MKPLRHAVLPALFSLVAATAFGQIKTPDSLIRKAFASLKAKDENAFVALYPNAQQFTHSVRSMIEKYMKSDEMKKMVDQMKKEVAADTSAGNINVDSLMASQMEAQMEMLSNPAMLKQYESNYRNAFKGIIQKGETKGVKWNDARLTGFTVDTSAAAGDESGASFLPRMNVKTAKGIIDFSAGNAAYQLAYERVTYLESEGGWFGIKFVQLARKGESLNPDKEESQGGDEMPAAKRKAPAKKSGTKPSRKSKFKS